MRTAEVAASYGRLANFCARPARGGALQVRQAFLSHPLVIMGVVSPAKERPMAEPITINCDDCTMQGTTACNDCVVTFICSRDPDEAIVVDVAEVRAMRLLASAGLVPELRHRRRIG
jgi:hypothetical protein